MTRTLDDADVLVTGGTGSLGRALVRRLMGGALGSPRRIVIFSRSEAAQYEMKTTWKHEPAGTDEIYYRNFEELVQFRIGDVRDYESVEEAVDAADVVFHVAAMKQVPTCEYFPAFAVETNVGGANNVVRAARRSPRTHTVIGISTDKACKPINVMGMTKAIQERVLVEGNVDQDHCRMVAVRYGNVLASRGSVLPLFRHQIATGAPVTITTPEMTRFFFTLDDAAETVFTAFQHAHRGEVLAPKLRSARIEAVADLMIGGRPIEKVFTGIRPGEKVHEVLVSDEEVLRTSERADHFVIEPHLPEFHAPREPRALERAYSSADELMSPPELHALLAREGLELPSVGAPSSLR